MQITTVTPESNRQAWKKQKETVSAEPKGLTYTSHNKAGALDDNINEFDSDMRDLLYRFGFSPQHWQSITDVEMLHTT
jgi:hypothetical protein